MTTTTTLFGENAGEHDEFAIEIIHPDAPDAVTNSGDGFCAFPDFDGDHWIEVIAPLVRGLAIRNLRRYGLRGELLEETADDICQIIATKALTNPALCDVESGGLRVVAVRNAVIDWGRKNKGIGIEAPAGMESEGLSAVRVRISHKGKDKDAGRANEHPGSEQKPAPTMARAYAIPASESAEDALFVEEYDGFGKLAPIAEAFRKAARAEVARLIREDAALERRLRKSPTSRGVFFTLLRRGDLLSTLLQRRGRDNDEGTAGENEFVAATYGGDVRTIRNRRSDWLRFLRELFAADLDLYEQVIRRLFPTFRTA